MNIIELARQSGFFVSTELRDDPSHERFERFSAAVIAARDKELIAGVDGVSAWLFKDMTWTPISAMGRDHGGAPAYSAEQVAGVVAAKDALIKEMQQDNLDWMKRSVGQEKRIAELEVEAAKGQAEWQIRLDAANRCVEADTKRIDELESALKVALEALETVSGNVTDGYFQSKVIDPAISKIKEVLHAE